MKHFIGKIEKSADSRGISAANIARQAIDAYAPHGAGDMEAPELLQLVHERLKEAIAATKNTNKRVANSLRLLKTLKV